jgi:ParB family chromosome partitioning protein
MPQEQKSPKAKKQNLGRGLGSLLGGDSGAFSKITAGNPTDPLESSSKSAPTPTVALQPQVPPESRIWNIPIEHIRPNKDQPRKRFEKEALEELAASIREKGIIQPLLLKKIGADQYEIIAGERRWRAAQKAEHKEVPALIKNLEEQEVLELALIENIQRKDLNPVEEAEAYELLMKRFHLTQQEMADRVGKDRATVANLLRLLSLSPELRQMVLNGELSQGQAKVLLSLSEKKDQMELALRVKAENLSVRALEKLVLQKKQPPKTPTLVATPQVKAQMAPLKEELQKLLGSRVDIEYRSGKGKLKLYFYSDEQLNQIIDRLRE